MNFIPPILGTQFRTETLNLLHDIALARQISSIVTVAESQHLSPDEAASGMQNFGAYWQRETAKLENMCRQHGEKPNLFFTVAPAEWKFPLHQGMLQGHRDNESLSDAQFVLTLHMYNDIQICFTLFCCSNVCYYIVCVCFSFLDSAQHALQR